MTDEMKKRLIKKQTADVRCQGCGGLIDPDGKLSDVEYVKTKRRSEYFFHRVCKDRVWAHRIC